MNNTQCVLADIEQERHQQDKKWGTDQTPLMHTQPGLGLAVLMEEVGEVAKAILKHQPEAEIRTELIQVAAVATKWIEAIDIDTKSLESKEVLCQGQYCCCSCSLLFKLQDKCIHLGGTNKCLGKGPFILGCGAFAHEGIIIMNWREHGICEMWTSKPNPNEK